MIVTVYSSLLFFVNYLNALYNEYNVYALLFLGLTISSVLHHSSFTPSHLKSAWQLLHLTLKSADKVGVLDMQMCINEVNEVNEVIISNSIISTKTISTIDKIFLYSVILYGGYILLNKIIDFKTELASITPEKIGLLITIFSTFLGTIFLFCSEKKYCFCIESEEALWWHAFLHFIASIGHHCIIFL